jgi:hypothetical protein
MRTYLKIVFSFFFLNHLYTPMAVKTQLHTCLAWDRNLTRVGVITLFNRYYKGRRSGLTGAGQQVTCRRLCSRATACNIIVVLECLNLYTVRIKNVYDYCLHYFNNSKIYNYFNVNIIGQLSYKYYSKYLRTF